MQAEVVGGETSKVIVRETPQSTGKVAKAGDQNILSILRYWRSQRRGSLFGSWAEKPAPKPWDSTSLSRIAHSVRAAFAPKAATQD